MLNTARGKHILHGDATGGGHLWPGLPGKTPFPRDWSATRIVREIERVAADATSSRVPTRGGRTMVSGMRDGGEIRVIVAASGEIFTGYPTNSPRNQ